jgi:TolA-binding protein
MKLAYCIAVLIALAPCAALAAPPAAPKEAASKETVARDKDCSTIKSITVRQACLDRQAAEHPGQQEQSRNMSDAVDDLKREDDLLAKKLKGICRGC